MKATVLSLLCVCAAFLSLAAQNRADQQHLADPKSFSMILMGDPQNYVKQSTSQPIYELNTVWIADNVDNLNIKAVLITGDMVNANDRLSLGTRPKENQTSKQMWEWTSHCLERLDNKVPYIICSGNHDYGYIRGDEGFTHFPEYITFERNSQNVDHIVATMPNRDGRSSIENAAYEFSDANWGKLLVISTEWAPRDEVLGWIEHICNKYKDHRVILLTHSYMKSGTSAQRTTSLNKSYTLKNQNQGQQMWDKLVKSTPNISLVLCGHAGIQGDSPQNSASYREDKNDAGKTVCQMMFNVQFVSQDRKGNGGEGWLRILEFLPDGKTVKVQTYSPLFGISPVAKKFAHRASSIDQFDMVLN